MPAQPSAIDHSLPPFNDTPETKRLETRLPPVLSAVAGMVDVISFVSLKLFTAHVTGNLVVIAALLVRGGPPNLAQILAVPVFILAVGGVWLIAKHLNKRGPALVRPLLLVQFLLLACVLMVAVVYHPAANPHGLIAVIAAMIAVSAMACQFTLLRLTLPTSPSTAVMTGNLTNTVLSVLDAVSSPQPEAQRASQHLTSSLRALIGFLVGCVLGALGVSFLHDWAWVLPFGLAGAAVAMS